MKGCRGKAPLILDLGAGWMWVVTIRLRPKVRTEEYAEWAPKPVLTFWIRGMSPVTSGIRAPDHRHKSRLRYLGLLLNNSRDLKILAICSRNRYHSPEDSCAIACVKVTMWNCTLSNMAGNGNNSVGEPREDSRDSISKRASDPTEGRCEWRGGKYVVTTTATENKVDFGSW
jgi:hypothetical protein